MYGGPSAGPPKSDRPGLSGPELSWFFSEAFGKGRAGDKEGTQQPGETRE